MGKLYIIVVTWLLSNSIIGESRLRITRLKVDSPMVAGEGGWLKCDWDGGGRPIYSAKWYIDRHEFYRWTPSEIDNIKVFPRPEFSVDTRKSRKGHVFIKDVTLKAAGMARCEVSEEGPIFHTEYNSTQLDIIDLPDSRPVISGARPMYRMHRDVSLTCRSPGSKPAAKLTFYVNGKPAEDRWLIAHRTKTDKDTSLLTASLGIRFALQPRLLRRGRVVVKCAAKIRDLYWESNEVVISVDLPQRASRMEERADTSSSCTLHTLPILVAFMCSILT